jgi:hypothetical protein
MRLWQTARVGIVGVARIEPAWVRTHPAAPKAAASTLPPHPDTVDRLVCFARYGGGWQSPSRSPIQGHYQERARIGLTLMRPVPSIRRRHFSLPVLRLDFQTEPHLGLKPYKSSAFGPCRVLRLVPYLVQLSGLMHCLSSISGLSP